MLTVVRNKSAVEINVTVPVPTTVEYVYTFKFEAGREDWAGFLADTIDKLISAHLTAERIEWYERGWKEGRSRRAQRRTWFPGAWKWPV